MSRLRVRLQVRGWRGGRSVGWLVGLLAALLLGLALLPMMGRGSAVADTASGPLTPLAPGSPAYFYVTTAVYNGEEALAACSDGYHLASLWELQEVSQLSYAVDHPAAKVREDSGQGPPSNWYGWLRTGGIGFTANQAGRANCQVWTSAEADKYGTIARLNDDWTAAGTTVSPWDSQAWACNNVAPAWCVSDLVYDSFLPVLGTGP